MRLRVKDGHDPLCIGGVSWGQCDCDMILKVREDERYKQLAREGQSWDAGYDVGYKHGRKDAAKAVKHRLKGFKKSFRKSVVQAASQ